MITFTAQEMIAITNDSIAQPCKADKRRAMDYIFDAATGGHYWVEIPISPYKNPKAVEKWLQELGYVVTIIYKTMCVKWGTEV